MNIVVILAGGNGSRMEETEIPKQSIKIEGRTILEHCIEIYNKSTYIDQIIIVANKKIISEVQLMIKKFSKNIIVIEGGKNRIFSVYNAFVHLKSFCNNDDKIIFTDGVRPCVLQSEVKKIISNLDFFECVTTGIESYETLMNTQNDGIIEKMIPRNGVYRQTSPEGYRFDALEKVYNNKDISEIGEYSNIGVDQLLEKGIPIKVVRCSNLNIKITRREDIVLFENIVKSNLLNSIEKYIEVEES